MATFADVDEDDIQQLLAGKDSQQAKRAVDFLYANENLQNSPFDNSMDQSIQNQAPNQVMATSSNQMSGQVLPNQLNPMQLNNLLESTNRNVVPYVLNNNCNVNFHFHLR